MTMTNEMTRVNGNGHALTAVDRSADASAVDAVIGTGDLAKLTADQRVNYYRNVCESVGLNPLTRPFDYIVLSGKMVLYATRGCADQLRKIHKVNIPSDRMTRGFNVELGLYEVEVCAVLPDGREDTDMAAVNVKGLQGEALANAIMKTMTKAKRRVTLSVIGLGWLDETEVDSIPDARPGGVDVETGEIIEVGAGRLTRDGTPRSERTPADQRTAPDYAPNSEDTLRETRRLKAAEIVETMKGIPPDQRTAWLERFESKWGIRNVKMLGLSDIDEALAAISAKDWPYEAEFQAKQEAAKPGAVKTEPVTEAKAGAAVATEDEADPFADPPALMDVPAAKKGHGAS